VDAAYRVEPGGDEMAGSFAVPRGGVRRLALMQINAPAPRASLLAEDGTLIRARQPLGGRAMEPLIAWLQQAGAKFGDLEITPHTDLIDQGVLDSLEILRLVAFLEERFRITVPVEEFVPQNFRTPSTVAAMVARLDTVRAQAAAPRH
jgi:acyl carrier protein